MFNKEIMVFDGAIGTELYERGFYINRPFEELNLNAPGDVLSVHKSYIDAGAQVITTNSFCIPKTQLKKFDIENKQAELLNAALSIANEAVAGTLVKIGVSIGPMGVLIEPLGPTSLGEVRQEYADIAKILQDCGYKYDLINLETFSNIEELGCAIDGIRSVNKTIPLLACISPKLGNTQFLHDFVSHIGTRPDVQALGLNCSEGPSEILSQLKVLSTLTTKPIVVQPNAGIPRQLNGRYFYMTSPDYLAKFAKRYVEAGAIGVGGCCGTGPNHIKAISQALKMMNAKRSDHSKVSQVQVSETLERRPRSPIESRQESALAQCLARKERVYSIELSSPKGIDLSKLYLDLTSIERAGIHFVNVPDGARAATRVGSLHLAAKVNRDFAGKITILPHLTTRDRNLIGLQADIIGAWINGVHELLLVTGDPPKLGNNKEATGVYDIDSIGLTHLVDMLNRGHNPNGDELGSHTDFCIGAAANPTAGNLELEINRWRYKFEMGVDFAVTQPIYDPESFLKWKDSIGNTYKPHLVGIWPFVSLRNAEFMANEVPGVKVPAWAIEEMQKAGSDKDEAIKRGIGIALKSMEALKNECEGFVVSAPLGKASVALDLYRQFGVAK